MFSLRSFACFTLTLTNPLYKRYISFILIALVSAYFLFFFTLASLFFFTFHSRYSFLYRCSFVFSLSGLVPPSSHVLLRFTLPSPSLSLTGLIHQTGLYLLRFWFLLGFSTRDASLSTTTSISLVFLSSSYLDVSVHWVFIFYGFPLWIFWFLLFSSRYFVSLTSFSRTLGFLRLPSFT